MGVREALQGRVTSLQSSKEGEGWKGSGKLS